MKPLIVGIEALKVEFVQSAGSDEMVLKTAKVSTGKEEIDMVKDIGLIKFLARNLHTSPFEHNFVTFRIECPLFVRSQWHRHRTQAYNEWSGRYSVVGEEFYLPAMYHKKGGMNKQGSAEEFGQRDNSEMYNMAKISVLESKKNYDYLIERGVSNEEARLILPQNMITKFFASASLLNWMRYCSLRCDAHTQYEHRILAKKLFKELLTMFPVSVAALTKSMFNEQTQVDVGLLAEGDKTYKKLTYMQMAKIEDAIGEEATKKMEEILKGGKKIASTQKEKG